MKGSKLLTFFLVLMMLISGLVVESILSQVNNRVFFLTGKMQDGNAFVFEGPLADLNNWPTRDLLNLKWVIIPAAILMFFSWTAAIIQAAFKNKQYQKWALVFHVTTVVIVGIVLITSKLIGLGETGQRISRGLLDFILSPLATMILVGAFYLDPERFNLSKRPNLDNQAGGTKAK